MKVSRKEAEEHLRAGRPVAFRTEDGTRTLEPRTSGRRRFEPDNLPGDKEKGEYVLLRDEQGNLTRAGMEEAIRAGGSVMFDGEVIEHIDDLPEEADLARGNAAREEAVRQSLDDQIALLQSQKNRLGQGSATPMHHHTHQHAHPAEKDDAGKQQQQHRKG